MFLLHVDISENGFNTIFWKFNRSVTKLEDADEIRSFDGTVYNFLPLGFFWNYGPLKG